MKKLWIIFVILLAASSLAQFSSPVKLTAVDSDGDGDIDGYITTLKKGTNITLSVVGQILTISGTGAGGGTDTVYVSNDANSDSISNINNAIHMHWGTGIDVALVNGVATVSIDATELSIPFADSSGSTTTEGIEDKIGAMVSGNTETGIDVTYDDVGGKLNFSVTGGGAGTGDTLIVADTSGTEHSIVSQLLKIKGGMRLYILDEDSTGYHVMRFNVVPDSGKADTSEIMTMAALMDSIASVVGDSLAGYLIEAAIRVVAHDSIWFYLPIDSTHVSVGGIAPNDIAQWGASVGQILKWNGSSWAPADDEGGAGSGDDVWADSSTAGDLSGLIDMSKVIIQRGTRTTVKLPNDTTLHIDVDSTKFYSLSQIRDSIFVYLDTDGNGSFETQIGPIYIRAGSGIGMSVNGDTLTLTATGGSGAVDTVWFVNSAADDSVNNVGNALHLHWGTGMVATISGKTLTVSVNVPVSDSTAADVDTLGTDIAAALADRSSLGHTHPDKPDTSISIIGASPLNGGGNLQDDRTIGLNEQSINKAYIDTGAGIPFGQAFHTTTAVPESAFVTEHRVPEISPTLVQFGKVTDDTTKWNTYGDSLGYDEDNDGTPERYGYPGVLSEGNNITFSGTGDRLIITGGAGGSGDNVKADTGDAVVDVSTAIIQAGPRGQVDVANGDTILVFPDSASFFSMPALKDTMSNYYFGLVDFDGLWIDTTAAGKFTLKANSVDSTRMGPASIDSSEIKNGAVTKPKIAADQITTYHIAPDSVNDGDIDFGPGAGQVNTDDVPEGSINKYDPFGVSIDWAELATAPQETVQARQTADQVRAILPDSLNKLVASHIGPDSIAVSKINWDMEYFAALTARGQTRLLTDSIYLTLSQVADDWGSSWLATDSAGNISPTKNDTLTFPIYVPYACQAETLIIVYRNKNANSSIVRYRIYGPDRSSQTDITDSSYVAFQTVSYTSTSWTRVAINITDIAINAGETFAIQLVTALAADYVAANIGSVKFAARR